MKNKDMDYKKRYSVYRDEVREHMYNIIDNYEIEDGFLLTLDLLAINLDMLYKSVDSIREDGFEIKDFKGRVVKNRALQQFNAAQTMITRLLSNFPSNSFAKERLKKLTLLADDVPSLLDEYIQ